MTQIDTTFLKVHPRTELWWKQREKCMRCENFRHRPARSSGNGSGSGQGMSCAVVNHGLLPASCIQAREEGSKCGPHGLLFVAKKTKEPA